MKFLFILALFSFSSFAQIYRHHPDIIAKWIGSYDEAIRQNRPAQSWTNDEWNGYYMSYPDPTSFTKQQQEIVWDYKTTEYTGINQGLRTGNPELLSKYAKHINAMDALMRTIKPIPAPIVVYRGERRTIFKENQYCLYLGYTSTTTGTERGEMFGLGGTYIMIQLPNRLKALRVSVVLPARQPPNHTDTEEELILPRNAWIRITDVRIDSNPRALTRMKVKAIFGVRPPTTCNLDPETQCCK